MAPSDPRPSAQIRVGGFARTDWMLVRRRTPLSHIAAFGGVPGCTLRAGRGWRHHRPAGSWPTDPVQRVAHRRYGDRRQRRQVLRGGQRRQRSGTTPPRARPARKLGQSVAAHLQVAADIWRQGLGHPCSALLEWRQQAGLAPRNGNARNRGEPEHQHHERHQDQPARQPEQHAQHVVAAAQMQAPGEPAHQQRQQRTDDEHPEETADVPRDDARGRLRQPGTIEIGDAVPERRRHPERGDPAQQRKRLHHEAAPQPEQARQHKHGEDGHVGSVHHRWAVTRCPLLSGCRDT